MSLGYRNSATGGTATSGGVAYSLPIPSGTVTGDLIIWAVALSGSVGGASFGSGVIELAFTAGNLLVGSAIYTGTAPVVNLSSGGGGGIISAYIDAVSLSGPNGNGFDQVTPVANSSSATINATATLDLGISILLSSGSSPTPPPGYTIRAQNTLTSTVTIALSDGVIAEGTSDLVWSAYGLVANGIVNISLLGESAPLAPTILSPTNAGFAEMSTGLEVTFQDNSTDGSSVGGYAFRYKLAGGGSYLYFNATTGAGQSSIVWNTSLVNSFTTPSGLLTDGDTYNMSVATQQTTGLQGPFASDITVTGQPLPTVTITGPSGSVGEAETIVTWTTGLPMGVTQTFSRVMVYAQATTTAGGFAWGQSSGMVYDSGTVANTAGSAAVSGLSSSTTYVAGVLVTDSSGEVSLIQTVTFTVLYDGPANPDLYSSPGIYPPTGASATLLRVQCHDNALPASDSTFEGTGSGSVGTWVGTGCTLTADDSWAADGAYSLKLHSTAGGNISASPAAVPVAPGQQLTVAGVFHSETTPRTVTLSITWKNAAGAEIETVVIGSQLDNAAGVQIIGPAISPATAVTAMPTVTISGTASAESHNFDCVLVAPGSLTNWTLGGFVGDQTVNISFSDDGVNYFPLPGGSAVAVTLPSQIALVYDHAAPQGFQRFYQAQVVVTQ